MRKAEIQEFTIYDALLDVELLARYLPQLFAARRVFAKPFQKFPYRFSSRVSQPSILVIRNDR